LLQKIETLGLLENTLILFVADHGFYLGEHGYIGKAYIREKIYQNLPLYSEICRIPFVAHFPGCQEGGAVKALVQPVSLAATICDFLNIKKPDSFAGPSLWPLLQGKEEKVADVVVSSPTLSSPQMKRPHPTNRASITDGRWLLVSGSTGPGDPDDKTVSVDSQQRLVDKITGEKLVPELYDLHSDPGCVKNVIDANKEVADDLHRRFVKFLKNSPMRKDHLEFF